MAKISAALVERLLKRVAIFQIRSVRFRLLIAHVFCPETGATFGRHALTISLALAGHIDPGEAFRATAAKIGTIIPHDHIDVAILLQDGRKSLF